MLNTDKKATAVPAPDFVPLKLNNGKHSCHKKRKRENSLKPRHMKNGGSNRSNGQLSDTNSNPDRTRECPAKKADVKKVGGRPMPSAKVILNNNYESATPEKKEPENHGCFEIRGAPWVTSDKSYSQGIVGLHEEIVDFYDWMTPTDAEHHLRCGLIQRVRQLISEQWNEARVDVFGSFKTGLYLPSSDIDLVIVGYWPELPLRTIERLLQSKSIPESESLKVLEKAAVPIVKFTDKVSKVKVDVSFNMNGGLRAAELIKHYRNVFPALSKLAYVLKHFLQQRDLNEVFTGGLSSYALILLIVHFLQRHPRKNAGSFNANLGVLLIEFFEYYGRQFNFLKNAIQIRDGGKILSKDEFQRNLINGDQAALISIEDPLDPRNDVGRSSYGALIVKQAFEKAYFDLTSIIKSNTGELAQSRSILSQILKVSQPLMEYRKWIASLNLSLDSSHINLCEFSKRPVNLPRAPLADIEPRELKFAESDNLSSESSRESVTFIKNLEDTDSDVLQSSNSSSMSVSPANSEICGIDRNQNKKVNFKLTHSSNTSLASSTNSSNNGWNVKKGKQFWGHKKDNNADRADSDMDWRRHNRKASADIDQNWRQKQNNMASETKNTKSQGPNPKVNNKQPGLDNESRMTAKERLTAGLFRSTQSKQTNGNEGEDETDKNNDNSRKPKKFSKKKKKKNNENLESVEFNGSSRFSCRTGLKKPHR